MELKLNNRLLAVGNYVRKDSVVADVGTDHAYLPIWLILNGFAKFAVASDINPHPLERAAANISLFGLSHSIKPILTNGLNGLDIYSPNDIVIAGMGGELICDIIEASLFVKNPNLRLILQPMTKSPFLRQYLIEHNFNIIDESLISEDNESRVYQLIYAAYCGFKQPLYSYTELILGRKNIADKNLDNINFINHVNHKLNAAILRADGMRKAGIDTSKDDKFIYDCRVLINDR